MRNNSLTKEKIENILKVLKDKKTDDFVSIHKDVLIELCELVLKNINNI